MSRFVRAVAAALAYALLIGVAGCESEREQENRTAHGDVAGQWDRLHEAGSASVTFDGLLYLDSLLGKSSGMWAGTSVIRLDAEPSSDTDYRRIDASTITGQLTSTKMRELRIGDDHWYRSPNLRTADGRPWIKRETGYEMSVGDPFADPNLGVTDLAVWLRFLREVPAEAAAEAKTDTLEDVAGAPREYFVRCVMRTPSCPRASFGSKLDQLFPIVAAFTISCWVGEDGRLRKLKAELELYQDTNPRPDRGVSEPIRLKTTFTLTGFGTPLTVTPPPASQVTEDSAPMIRS